MAERARGWFRDGTSRFIDFRYQAPGVVRLEIRDDHLNPGGRLAGTVVFGLVDYAMGSALWPLTEEDEDVATVNVALNFVATAREGAVVCTAEVDRRTRTNAVLRAAVAGEDDDRLIATAIGSYAILPAQR